MKPIQWIMLLLAVVGSISGAEFKNVGHAGANFLQIAAEPAGAALGNAAVAHVRGVAGLYWNPGGLTEVQKTGILMAHADWILDTRLSYLGVVHNFQRFGTLGLSLTAVTMADMEITTESQPNGTGEYFSAGDYALGLSYAWQFTDRFSFGATAKYVYEFIWETNTRIVTFDFGSVYRTDFHHLRIGMSLTNFGGLLKMQGDPIDQKARQVAQTGLEFTNDPRLDRLAPEYGPPQQFSFGVAFDPLHSEHQRLTVMTAAINPNDNDTRLNLAGEYAFKEKLFLRLGYKNGYVEQRLSAGLGVEFQLAPITFGFDYGYADFGILGGIHYTSVRFGF